MLGVNEIEKEKEFKNIFREYSTANPGTSGDNMITVIGNSSLFMIGAHIAHDCIIGNNVFIGPNATLTNDRHPPSGGKWEPAIVEDDVVIGANATIVAGVKLNTGCVIAAGAVVTSDIPSNQVWGGIPAKLLMTREEYNTRRDQH